MTEDSLNTDDTNVPANPKRKGRDARPLTTDERASFVILALYMVTFCICTFVYWDSLTLKIIGGTVASGGLFLFAAAFFNTEAPEQSNSIHPLRSYLFSLVIALLVLFTLRFIGGLITHFVMAVMILYGGLLIALVVFRKALVQVITALLVMVFLFVTISNHQAVLMGHMKFQDAVRQCGQP